MADRQVRGALRAIAVGDDPAALVEAAVALVRAGRSTVERSRSVEVVAGAWTSRAAPLGDWLGALEPTREVSFAAALEGLAWLELATATLRSGPFRNCALDDPSDSFSMIGNLRAAIRALSLSSSCTCEKEPFGWRDLTPVPAAFDAWATTTGNALLAGKEREELAPEDPRRLVATIVSTAIDLARVHWDKRAVPVTAPRRRGSEAGRVLRERFELHRVNPPALEVQARLMALGAALEDARRGGLPGQDLETGFRAPLASSLLEVWIAEMRAEDR